MTTPNPTPNPFDDMMALTREAVDDINRLQERLDVERRHVAELQATLNRHNEGNVQLNVELTRIHKRVVKLEEDNSRLSRERAELQETMRGERRLLTAALNERDALREVNEQLNNNCNILADELRKTKQERDGVRAEAYLLGQKLDATQQANAEPSQREVVAGTAMPLVHQKATELLQSQLRDAVNDRERSARDHAREIARLTRAENERTKAIHDAVANAQAEMDNASGLINTMTNRLNDAYRIIGQLATES
jgi:DNA repair exonuclease SbcCD ATPase subunit